MTPIYLLNIDTTAPTAVTLLDLPVNDDWGFSGTDNITSKNKSLTITGSLPSDAVAANLYVEYDATGTGTSYNASSLLGTARAASGGFIFNTSATTALADGKYRIRAKAVDAAGNESAVNATAADLVFTIDTGAPAVPTLNVDPADMKYISGNTRLTNNTNFITLSGSGEANAKLQVFNDLNNNGIQDAGEPTMTLYSPGTGTVVGSPVLSGAGTYSYDLVYLSDGAYNLRTVTTDAAGNSSTSAALSFVLDRTVNPVQSIELAPNTVYSGNDSGGSSYDYNTTDTTPTFRVWLSRDAEAGDSVRVLAYYVYNEPSTLANVTLSAGDISAGYVDVTPATAMSAATYSGTTAITAWYTDKAGNRSTSVALPKSLVIDSTAPTTPGFVGLLNADDSGVSPTDNIIRTGTNLSFGNNASYPLASDVRQVEVLDVFGGNTTSLGFATISGNIWSFTYQGTALADGVHSIGIKTTDAAGNTSALSTARLSVTVDSSASAVFTAAITAATDSGVLGDSITKNTTPVISGTAEAGARIQVYRDINGNGIPEPNELVTVYSTGATYVTADGSGNFSFTLTTQPAGTQHYLVVQQDKAGNFNTLTVGLTIDMPVESSKAAAAAVEIAFPPVSFRSTQLVPSFDPCSLQVPPNVPEN